ncbi:MAG: hypothetical protein P8103_17055 [Candidatus Thiodiazotropha sp.]|jgi:hypothetical protein
MPDHFSRIFLLSHMRAFTSLAGHILGSNPAINGYYEMHLGYEDTSALEKQLSAYCEHDVIKEHSRFLFDKLLHNDYRLMPERLGPVPVTIMVALREPASTIRSIVQLFSQKQSGDTYASPESASRYYIDRLEWLARFCRTTEHDYHYFDAELLLSSPERLLSSMSGWLQLDEPLSQHYRLFSQTGQARKGDSSKFISSGRIDQSRSDHTHIQIPAHVLNRARETYQRCRQQMIAHAVDALTL